MDIPRNTPLVKRFFVTRRGAIQAETLADKIKKGERAITIQVDDISGVAGMLRPGDTVDVIGIFPMETPGKAGGLTRMETMVKTVLSRVTILAIGDIIDQHTARYNKRARKYRTVTLAVRPREADLIVFAQSRTPLMLTLCNKKSTYQIYPTVVSTSNFMQIIREIEIERKGK